jgi:hypothetical protein
MIRKYNLLIATVFLTASIFAVYGETLIAFAGYNVSRNIINRLNILMGEPK